MELMDMQDGKSANKRKPRASVMLDDDVPILSLTVNRQVNK